MNIEIANKLVKLRKEHNLSQEDLANKLGISRQAVSKWERAEASPDTDNLICLAKLYNVSLDDLLKNDDDLQTFITENRPVEKAQDKKEIDWNKFPYPLVAVIAFFLLIFIGGFYTSAWLVLITIPLYYSLIKAIKERNANYFAYPLLAAIAFFIMGFAWNLWSIAWIVFLTIPVYYGIVSMFHHDNLEE